MTRTIVVVFLMLLASSAGAQTMEARDLDNDGTISEAEFRAAIEDGVFARWDRDDDEALGPAEFADAVYALWDRDDDGALTVEEWDRAIDVWFGENAVNLSVDVWDADGDGLISSEEFRSAIEETDLFARLEADEDPDELLGQKELADALFGIADVDEDTFLGEEEDWFLVDLIELFNAPDDEPDVEGVELDPADPLVAGVEPATEDAGPVDEPIGGVFAESFVGLPIPCGTNQGGQNCTDTAQRLCTVLGLGEPIDFLEIGGELYAVRCDEGI